MVEIRETDQFRRWLEGLRDLSAKSRILVRIRRLSLGNPGDVRSVGDGVSELRVDYGPGYRVYFTTRHPDVIVLLTGGHKGTQSRDIAAARQLAHSL